MKTLKLVDSNKVLKRHTHTCHWPGCQKEVPEQDWGCERHWMLVPAEYKIRLIKLYRKGQVIDKSPSDEYVDVAVELHHWCRLKNKQYNGNPLDPI